MLKLGLLGLPNVGKSTVFNALSQAGARVSNFPFCTIEPNLGVVPVPDPRLQSLALLSQQTKVTPATIEFVDIAGLVKGASKGEGLGNQFLSYVRGVDGLIEVVRCFTDPDVGHVESSLGPVRDMQIIDLELVLADLELVLRRLEETKSKAKSGASQWLEEIHFLEKLRDHLDGGKPARALAIGPEDKGRLQALPLLTTKPLLYLANIGDEKDAAATGAAEALKRALPPEAQLLSLNARLESELGELSEQERAEFIAELGLESRGLERVIAASYRLLDLITFFTIVGKELRAWPVRKGTTARKAAGKIHSDMEAGFIKAEVIGLQELMELGAWEEAHRLGRLRIEGKDYLVREGDIVHFRFRGQG